MTTPHNCKVKKASSEEDATIKIYRSILITGTLNQASTENLSARYRFANANILVQTDDLAI